MGKYTEGINNLFDELPKDFIEKKNKEELEKSRKDHNVASTGEFIPKELKLDKIKSPLKNRTVEFSENSGYDGESGLNTDKRFLKYIKNFYHQLYKLHQLKYI